MPAVHLFWCTAVLAYLHEAGIRFSYFMAPAADWGHHLLPPKKINAKRRMTMYTALTIAGSDSSGGAGIQADLKTMTAHGVYGMSAITALTAQNTTGVTGIMEVSPEFLGEQLDDIFTDIFPDAVKIGMVSSAGLIEMIAGKLAFYQASHIVVDPVMAATSGSRLIDGEAVAVLKDRLIPMADLLTPNVPEAEILSGMKINSPEDMEQAARLIGDRCGCASGLTIPTPMEPAAPFPAPLPLTWQKGWPWTWPWSGPRHICPAPWVPCLTWEREAVP